MAFDQVPKLDYELPPQVPLESPEPTPGQMAAAAAALSDEPLAAAPMLVGDYGRTIEFAKFLTAYVDDLIKDVVVQIDPEEDPEVWMAMKRLFGDTANPALSGRAYCQVLDLQRKCAEIEVAEADQASAIEDAFIRRFQEAHSNG
jgi:hypothetical protein